MCVGDVSSEGTSRSLTLSRKGSTQTDVYSQSITASRTLPKTDAITTEDPSKFVLISKETRIKIQKREFNFPFWRHTTPSANLDFGKLVSSCHANLLTGLGETRFPDIGFQIRNDRPHCTE